jgi:bifunctional UDP-N-acetylglucosamine pyrophosphorylase / glucosamine-1-phosphate N-acetyltransferase
MTYSSPFSLVVLAAGKGSRMQSDLPKVLHLLAGRSLLEHVLAAGSAIAPERTIVVTGHGGDAVARVARSFDSKVCIAHQENQLGTGHAVATALPALTDFKGKVLVHFGDTPFVRPETLQRLLDAPYDIAVLGFVAVDPGRYGRLLLKDGRLERIVEWKDATEEEREITACNSGLMAVDAEHLRNLLPRLSNSNAAEEYYVTDLVGLGRSDGLTTGAILCDENETLGINTPEQLREAEHRLRAI